MLPNSNTSTAKKWTRSIGRGPDCLVVKLHPPQDGQLGEYHLAEDLINLLNEQFKHRLVLEMDDVTVFLSAILRELIVLRKQIEANGGILRLSGLNPVAAEVLQATNLEGYIPTYSNSRDAIMTFHPAHEGAQSKPR